MPRKRRAKGRKKRRGDTLPPDVNTYIVGSTWTDAQREYLEVFFTAINAAAEQVRYKCLTSVKEHDIFVKASRTGDGVFGGKDVPQGTYVGYYFGVVENARVFKDDGYSIGIPPIKFPDGTVVPALLSGYEQRLMQGSGAVFNSACLNFNAEFMLEDVFVRTNIEAYWEMQNLLEKGDDVPAALIDAASEILYSYPVVIAMTNKDVKAGDEIRVTYNRTLASDLTASRRVRYSRKRRSGYFTTRLVAVRNAKSAGDGYCIAKCMCEPGGCPLKHYFVTKKAAAAAVVAPPAAAAVVAP